MPLSHNNSSRSYYLQAHPPSGSPQGASGQQGAVFLEDCGDAQGVDLYLDRPTANYGVLEGTVKDEETGEPLAEQWLTVGFAGSVQTDQNGYWRIENVFLGYGDRTSGFFTARVTPTGYWEDSRVGGAAGEHDGAHRPGRAQAALRRHRGDDPRPRDGRTDRRRHVLARRDLRDDRPRRRLSPRPACRSTHATRRATCSSPPSPTATGRGPAPPSSKPARRRRLDLQLLKKCTPARIVGTVVNARDAGADRGCTRQGGRERRVHERGRPLRRHRRPARQRQHAARR